MHEENNQNTNLHCFHPFFVFLHNSLTVDEVQAKVALVHDEERVLSEDEAVVSRLSFIQFTIVPAALTVTTKIESNELPPIHVTASFHLTDAHSAHFRVFAALWDLRLKSKLQAHKSWPPPLSINPPCIRSISNVKCFKISNISAQQADVSPHPPRLRCDFCVSLGLTVCLGPLFSSTCTTGSLPH